MEIIVDGTGKGFSAQVDKNNQLRVRAESESVQHTQSLRQHAYQIIGVANLASGVVTALHIKNISSKKNLVVSYIRHQIVGNAGGSAFPNTSNYFKIAAMRERSSGGTKKIPINVNFGSGNKAEVTAYEGAPTLTGTAKEIDRWYTKSEGDMSSFNKEGAVIVSPNTTLELSYVGDQTSGILYTRLSFYMKDID